MRYSSCHMKDFQPLGMGINQIQKHLSSNRCSIIEMNLGPGRTWQQMPGMPECSWRQSTWLLTQFILLCHVLDLWIKAWGWPPKEQANQTLYFGNYVPRITLSVAASFRTQALYRMHSNYLQSKQSQLEEFIKISGFYFHRCMWLPCLYYIYTLYL